MAGATCSLSCIFASDLAQLYVTEFFFGVAYGLQSPACLALIVDMSVRDRMGLFFAIFESAYDIAEALPH